MPNWTTPQDVIDRWIGSGAPTDTDLLNTLITDAETVILSEFPLIQSRITDLTLSADTVTFVTVRMVTRVLRNPDNATYLQQTTGPFGQARNFGEAIDIWMSPAERGMLAPNKRGKAFSIDLAPNKTDGTIYAPGDYSTDSLIWTDRDDLD